MRTGIPATAGDLGAFAMRAVADQQIRVVLRCSGRLDVDRLQEARRLLVDAWPVLGWRLVLGRRPRWAPGAEAAQGGVAVIDAPGGDFITDAPTALAGVLAVSTDPRIGPVFDAQIVRPAESASRDARPHAGPSPGASPPDAGDLVCLRVDHAVCDGAGARQLAYRLLDLYRLLGEGAAEREAARLAALWAPDWRSYRPLLHAARAADVARAAVLFPDHTARFRLPYHGRARTDPRLSIVRIPAERVARARTFAHTRAATLNDVLLTAAFRALPAADDAAGATGRAGARTRARVPDPPAARPMQMPIDLRPRGAPLPAALLPPANITGMTFPAVAVRPGEPFAETLRRVTAATARARSDVAALHIPAAFSLLFALAGTGPGLSYVTRHLRAGHVEGRCTPMVTNFGVLDPLRLDPGGGVCVTDAFVASPLAYPPGFTVGISEFDGALTLSSLFCAAAIEPVAVEDLLRAIADELPG